LLDAVVQFVIRTGDMDGIEMLAECVMQIDGRDVAVGWRGRMAAWYRKDLLRMLDTSPVAS
jgi:hypothetical protein